MKSVVVIASITVAIAAGAVGCGSRGEPRARRPSGLPSGVLVCRNPVLTGPEVLGGGWQCQDNTDIGTAPIRAPESLMCSTHLSGVNGEMIGIRVFYFATLIRHANVQSDGSDANPYAEFDGSYVDYLDKRLPLGNYRCRFLVSGKVVRSRSFAIGSARLRVVTAPARYRYAVRLETLKGQPRGDIPTHVGDEFAVVVSSLDLPRDTAARVDVCVNGTDGGSCYYGEYVIHGRPIRVDWPVDRGDGVGALYRLTVESRGRTLAHRDLRLVPHT
jgi:hypothetical protein